jgi:hypothetical protein
VDVATLRSDLAGCPGAAHFAWWLASCWEGAATIDLASVREHLAPADNGPPPEWFVDRFQDVATGDDAIVELIGWRTSRLGDQIVTYRSRDDRRYDLVAFIDPPTGRMLGGRTMRSANGVDIGAKPVAELTPSEWVGVHKVFEASYRNADHDFVERRVRQLSTIAMGWRADEMLGFSAVGVLQADMGPIGSHSYFDGGLLCIDPSAHNLGLSNAIGSLAIRATPDMNLPEFTLFHFATPVTLRAAFRFGRVTWPGNTINEVAAALASPTSCQKEVGSVMAKLAGAKSYDADHWVIHSAHPAGETTAVPADLEPDYAQLFAHVDARKGDTLLGIFWWEDPPEAWFR